MALGSSGMSLEMRGILEWLMVLELSDRSLEILIVLGPSGRSLETRGILEWLVGVWRS